MHDLTYIRKSPDEFDAALTRRYLEPQSSIILELDEARRAVQTELQTVQQSRNEKSKEIGKIKAQGGDAQDIMDEVAGYKTRMGELEAEEQELGSSLNDILSRLPNILKSDVPDGKDEDDNVEEKRWFPAGEKEPRVAKNGAKEHWEIGEALGLMDFETAAKLSGSRFVLMRGALAKLERALAQYMLDVQTEENGYVECSPPLLVNTDVMFGTGQLPKFEDDQYETTNGQWLIPTAEVVLTNFVREEILEADSLPRRYTAYTPCFRKEAGSAGKDTRGMLRQHQFYKVEMVSITHPDESDEEHERMTRCAEKILENLELPYRRMALCAGDTGFSARKTYDLEVWLPGQDAFREISSCSTCGEFQARRMKARFKDKGEKQTQFVHTLNGSGLAVGRTLIAVMENYYDPSDGGIWVPSVLQSYMNGIEKIAKI